MVNSIVKGKNFERQIAHLLTEVTGVKWNRVPMSGAFATNNNSDDPRFSGDVFTEDKEYEDIVIECKSYASLEVNDFFSDKSNFAKWIKQAIRESEGKRWVLFIKIKNKGVYMLGDGLNSITSHFKNVDKFIMVNKRLLYKLK